MKRYQIVMVLLVGLLTLAQTFCVGMFIGGKTKACLFQADKTRDPPPAGEQFDEGPVLVRLPGVSNAKARFIF